MAKKKKIVEQREKNRLESESKYDEPNRISTGLMINKNYLSSCSVQHVIKMAGAYGKNDHLYELLYPLLCFALCCITVVY